MQSIHRLIPAAVLAFMSASTLATTIYTSSSAFLAAVAPGAYTETFDALPEPGPAAPSFSGGGFSYSASAPNDVLIGTFPAPYFASNGQFLGTSQIDEPLTILFTSGNVRAVGGEFFATDLNNTPLALSVTVTLNDGTFQTFTPTSFGDAFRGFVSDAAITSLVIGAPGQMYYAGLDNLTVGTIPTVPEPTSVALVGLAFAGLLAARRRAA